MRFYLLPLLLPHTTIARTYNTLGEWLHSAGWESFHVEAIVLTITCCLFMLLPLSIYIIYKMRYPGLKNRQFFKEEEEAENDKKEKDKKEKKEKGKKGSAKGQVEKSSQKSVPPSSGTQKSAPPSSGTQKSAPPSSGTQKSVPPASGAEKSAPGSGTDKSVVASVSGAKSVVAQASTVMPASKKT